MSLTEDERRAIVETRIEKSRRAYAEAKGVVQLQYWDTAANRLYYAAYNAVTALLVSGGDTAQTHSGVIHLFGQRYIKTGILPAELGRLYHRLFTVRQTGDYDDTYGLTGEDVLPFVEPTGAFIETVSALATSQLQS